jgi:hypothetical protein
MGRQRKKGLLHCTGFMDERKEKTPATGIALRSLNRISACHALPPGFSASVPRYAPSGTSNSNRAHPYVPVSRIAGPVIPATSYAGNNQTPV